MSRKPSRIRLFLIGLFRYLAATVSFSILLYILFALLFSTDRERQLKRENRLYRERYARMQEKERLIGDVIEGLLNKDDAIYAELFDTAPPSVDALTATDVIAANDSLSESFYLSATASTAEDVMRMARNVDDNFAAVFRAISLHRDSIPPLTLPLHNMSYVQVGASVGTKINPLYKVPVRHDGLDLIAPQGAPVYAADDGVVTQVVHSRVGLGNYVEIDHGNGYTTRYCFLGDMKAVKGLRVKTGQQIGTVGMSGTVSAPHLHFEVRRDACICDPIHYLFASVTPEEYARMTCISASTSQSLD